ncbi:MULTISPECIES: SAM-dependent methyltransferase [Streptomyces]|uniref:SAM-dependent methyltransferase n=1 Tax=Streptomyces TaxID=1883 RepID=UPI001F3AB93C|nr:SAM-dependent methyltransferase [Streptomyces noursei]MCE4946671.1 nodulation S family protein [Streptomyces noursei]
MNTPAAYFAAQYAAASDPWQLTRRWYERRKYALTLAALPRPRYRAAFEPGCSVGVLTRHLARRCDRLLAADAVPHAAATATARTRDLPHVEVRCLAVPGQWPAGAFDLVVLSELLYYFDDATLWAVLDRTVGSLAPGGTVVTAHWNHRVPEHLRTGTELAAELAAVPELSLLCDVRDADFTLQTFARRHRDGSLPHSPAVAEGLV